MRMAKGIFITFEGIDGAGKSSHIEPLANELRARGLRVTVTREPGGTQLSEKLRALILNEDMDPLTEAMLAVAARRDHVNRVIRPSLARGEVVLCDRFTDSTMAYQGYGRGLDRGTLNRLDMLARWAHPGSLNAGEIACAPDITILFDIQPDAAAGRLAGTRAPDRFESEMVEFFKRVRGGYLALAQSSQDRFIVISALQDKAKVWQDVAASVLKRLGLDEEI